MNILILCLLIPWYGFLLYRLRSAHVFHAGEAKMLVGIHGLLLLFFTMALLKPYASSGLSLDSHGRSFGMSRLMWNPMLGICTRGALVVFPYSWIVWIQRRRVHFIILLMQVGLAIAVLHWQSLTLPNACDYNIPAIKDLSLCG